MRVPRPLAGLLVAALLLAALELLAALLPLERFEGRLGAGGGAVFTRGEGPLSDRYLTAPAYRGYLNAQTFPVHKARGVTRIFFLGGSAALGWPSSDECAFTGVLRRALDQTAPGRFEIVNAAAMSFGSRRVLDVLRDVVRLDPDLVVIWSGNNEYVERNAIPPGSQGERLWSANRLLLASHLYRATRLAIFTLFPSLLRRPAGSDITDQRLPPRVQRGRIGRLPEIDREVRGTYRDNLASMAQLLRKHGVKAVFCTVPVNLSDWAPYTVSPRFERREDSAAWGRLMEEGVGLLERGDNRRASERFARAAKLAPDYALAPFFQAKALQQLGEFPHAYRLFSLARDEDARPLRAMSSFNEAVRDLGAARGDVTVVDLEEDFRAASGPNLVGGDLFIDYCHPNPLGHRVAARSLARVLWRLVPAFGSAPGLEAAIDGDSCPQPDNAHRAVAAYALGLTRQNNGLDAQAEDAYREALRYRADFPEAESNLGVLLRMRGARAEAEDHFRRALRLDPEDSVALFHVGTLELEQGRLAEAGDLMRRILAGNPQNPQALEVLGDIAARGGAWDEAVGRYREAVGQGGEHFELRRKLGDAYHALGREPEAAREWGIALALRPDDAETRSLLEQNRR